MGFEKIACCYHKLTAYHVQYTLLVVNIICFILNIVGLAVIKWEIIPRGYKLLYAICLIIYVFSTGCVGIIIHFRRKKTINGKHNRPSIKISIANIILSIIGILFSIICLVIIWIKYDHNKHNYNASGKKVISGWNRFFMFLTLGVNSRGMSFLFFLWISILIRLLKKTNGAYIQDDVKNVANISTSTISNNNEVKINNSLEKTN